MANPRAVYQDYALTTSQWYDLCDDGTVRSPSASGPCQGSLIANSPYNNWVYTAGTASTPGQWVVDDRQPSTRACTTSTVPMRS